MAPILQIAVRSHFWEWAILYYGYSVIDVCSWGLIDEINSSAPSAAYVVVAACSVPSHYLNQYWISVDWTLVNKFESKFYHFH